MKPPSPPRSRFPAAGAAAALALALAAFPERAAHAAADVTPCPQLVALSIPHAQIDSATHVAAGLFKLPGSFEWVSVPDFCRVQARAQPVADSEIHLEVWIPAGGWNGKLQGLGNGGYSGALDYFAMARALRSGYATAAHDTGHSGEDVRFGQGHPEKVVDYAYRAVHIMAGLAKLVIRAATGRLPDHSYFFGCSAGGHQALSEAQRYPQDFDGIIAGAPANNRIHQIFGQFWSWMAAHPNGKLILPADKLTLITRAVVAACDTFDGLHDGLIDDPRACHFDAAALLCRGGDAADCLTAAQVDAVRKIHNGLTDPQSGRRIYSGWTPGSEDIGDQSWRTILIDPSEPLRASVLRYFLFDDPNWDWHTLRWDRDLAYAEAKLGFLAAVDPDLAAFARAGGKLILYAGWSDPVVPAAETLAYYEAVTRAAGGDAPARGFARLFLAPGMGHCGGGAGPQPNPIELVAALDAWVVQQRPPERVLAARTQGGRVVRTRPLCPYPEVARYQGKGSIDVAANFACAPR